MHSKRFIIGSLMLSAWALPVAAQSVEPDAGPSALQTRPAQAASPALTLERAIGMALAANPGLRARAFDVAITSATGRQAALLPNPEISFLQEGTERGTRTRSIELSQVLELGGKRAARMALAVHDDQVAAGVLDVARLALRVEVSSAYFNALGFQERVRLARTSLDIAAKARAAAQRRVAAGRVSPIEQARAVVAESAARFELGQAEGELAIALDALAAYWGGAWPATQALAEPEADSPPLPSLESLRRQLEGSPQLRLARLQVQREDAQLGLARSQRMPDLKLIVGRKKEDEIGHAQTVLGLSLPLPLFDRNQGKLLAALGRAGQARAEADAERLRLEQALGAAYRRAELARQQVSRMRQEVLPAAQQVFEAAVTGFEAGKFGFLDVLDAQRTLLHSRTQFIQLIHESYRSMAELDRFAHAHGDANTTRKITP